MSSPSSASSLSRGEGTGASGGPSPSLGRSDGGRPPPAPSPRPPCLPSPAVAAAAAADPAAPRAGTRAAAAAAAAATAAKPPRQQQQQQQRRGRNPFASAVLNTYALPGTEHATWRRWLLELGLFLGWALAALGPAVGLAVMTPYISVTSGLASDLRKDADCLKVAPEVSERDAKERRGGGREGGGERERATSSGGAPPFRGRAPREKKKKDVLTSSLFLLSLLSPPRQPSLRPARFPCSSTITSGTSRTPKQCVSFSSSGALGFPRESSSLSECPRSARVSQQQTLYQL